MQPIASLHSNEPELSESHIPFRCFCMSFSGIWGDSCHLCDLPDTNKPRDGDGLVLNLLGAKRWQPFSTCILKLICKCLTEGTLYVEGLIHTSFVKAACSLVSCGGADVQMVSYYLFVSLVIWFILSLASVTGAFNFLWRCDDLWDINLTSDFIWKACFEFASLVGSILTVNILPHVGLIQSIILLLGADEGLSCVQVCSQFPLA